jgi:hypothetical protein
VGKARHEERTILIEMNTPGNNLLTNAANSALPTALSSAASSLGVEGNSLTWVAVLLGLVFVATVVIVSINYFRWSESPWLGDRLTAFSHFWDWLPSRASATGLTEYGALRAVDTPPPTPGAPASTSTATRSQENWCFVGEDLTGRWCVKVPQPDSCTQERLFTTRSECELVTASKSPLGIIKDGGADQTLLAALHTK